MALHCDASLSSASLTDPFLPASAASYRLSVQGAYSVSMTDMSDTTDSASDAQPLSGQVDRQHALSILSESLTAQDWVDDTMLALIAQYHLEPDELTEAGLSYETVKALEQHHPHLFQATFNGPLSV